MRALALVESPDHVCARYRLRAFEPSLHAAGWSLTVLPLARGALARRRQLHQASDFEVTVLQRKLLSGWMLWELRRHARRLVFDFDDAVLYRDSYDPRGPHCPRRLRRFMRTVRAADTVVAGNHFLASRAQEAGARNVRVIPTCVDPRQLPVRNPVPGERGRLDLVWVGSSSTLRGLEQARKLWDQVGRKLPGVRLTTIADRPAELGSLPVAFRPWSARTEAAAIASADTGISQMPDDLWSRGKCGLKVLQYQAAALPAVASAVGVHPEMIEGGRTGFLPQTADAWLDSLAWLRDNPEPRLEMGQEACRRVEAGYSVTSWAPAVIAAFDESTPPGPASAPADAAPLSRRAAGLATARIGS